MTVEPAVSAAVLMVCAASSVLAMAAAIAAWYFSDAKSRGSWILALQHTSKRLDALELAFPQWKMEMGRLSEEAQVHLDEARSYRRREAGKENRAKRDQQPPENGPPPAPGTTEYDQALVAMAARYR
ncbi:MAG: hypothetical protein V3T33_09885 [Myxococcota bacterium]